MSGHFLAENILLDNINEPIPSFSGPSAPANPDSMNTSRPEETSNEPSPEIIMPSSATDSHGMNSTSRPQDATTHPHDISLLPSSTTDPHIMSDIDAPTTAVSELETPDEANVAICPICYDSLGESMCRVVPCGHMFCFECISRVILDRHRALYGTGLVRNLAESQMVSEIASSNSGISAISNSFWMHIRDDEERRQATRTWEVEHQPFTIAQDGRESIYSTDGGDNDDLIPGLEGDPIPGEESRLEELQEEMEVVGEEQTGGSDLNNNLFEDIAQGSPLAVREEQDEQVPGQAQSEAATAQPTEEPAMLRRIISAIQALQERTIQGLGREGVDAASDPSEAEAREQMDHTIAILRHITRGFSNGTESPIAEGRAFEQTDFSWQDLLDQWLASDDIPRGTLQTPGTPGTPCPMCRTTIAKLEKE